MTPGELVKRFQLEPLPLEGGLFQRHYAAQESIPADALPVRYTHAKLFASAICYMHTPQTRSLFHALKTDELYHFYNGDPVSLVLLYPEGTYRIVILGRDYAAGHVPFFVVPKGVMQGSCLMSGGAWALMGATMAPAYDDDDFVLGARAELVEKFPAAREWIERLT